MKRIALTLLLLCLLVGAPCAAIAQSPELMAAFRQYQTLNAQGKYAEAEAAREAAYRGYWMGYTEQMEWHAAAYGAAAT